MPAAPDELLFKSLARHSSSLDHTFLGCMTRIFHVFEGHPGGGFLARPSSGSSRLGVHGNVDSGGSHPNRHDRRNSTSGAVLGDGHKKTVHPASHHRRSYSDITDMATTPSRACSEDTKPASSEDPRPACSDDTEPAYAYEDAVDHPRAFNNYETLRAAASFAEDPRRRSDFSLGEHSSNRSLTPASPKRASRQQQQQQKLAQKASSSSEIRDSLLATFLPETRARGDLSRKKNNGAGSHKDARSNTNSSSRSSNGAVFARGLEPSELLQWKDGLRSSSPTPKGKYEKSPSRSCAAAGAPKLIVSHHSSPERRVDPPKNKSRPKNLMPGLQGKDVNSEVQESPGASYFRESLKPFLTSGSQEFESRRGQRLPNARDTSVNVIARLMGLEEIVTSSSGEKCVSVTSKVKDANLFRGLVQFDPQTATRSTSPPPFSQTKKHGSHQGMHEEQYPKNYPEQYNMERELSCYDEDGDYGPTSRPFLSVEDGFRPPPKPLADAFQAEDHGAVLAEVFPGSLMKQASTRKKKMLWKILEAMRPKGLLKMSRRKQHAEPNGTKHSVAEQPIQHALEMQLQPIDSKPSCGLETDELSRNPNSVMQTQSSNSGAESSAAKGCVLSPDESTTEVTKPVNRSLVSECSEVIFQVRQAETATCNSNEQEVCRTADDEEDCNLRGSGQRDATNSGAALEDPTRSPTAESPCEIIDLSRADHVRESGKIRGPAASPNYQGPVPSDTEREHRPGPRASSPELSRPPMPKRTPSKVLPVPGRKPLRESGGKRDAHPRAPSAKEDVLKRRVTRTVAKAGVVRLKQRRPEGAVATPPEEVAVDVSRPSTTEPAILLDSPGLPSNSDVQIQPQLSDSEHLVCKTFKEPHVQLSEEQPEVQPEAQMIESGSVGDLLESPEPANSEAWIPEPQTSLQIQETEVEASEELTTPRGGKLKFDRHDDNLVVTEMDRPSPVSVLDPTTFDEDLTASPTSRTPQHNHVVPTMQVCAESTTTDTVDEEHEGTHVAALEANEESPPPTLDDILGPEPDGGGAEPGFSVDPEMATSCKSSNNKVSMISDSTGFELQEPRAPRATVINNALLRTLQGSGVFKETDHRLLLHCLEEIMERVLVESQHSAFQLWVGLPADSLGDSAGSSACKGRRLEQELWREMVVHHCTAGSGSSPSSSDDVCDVVHGLLLGNLVHGHGRQWGSFSGERERVGVHVESMIVRELIEEAVHELCDLEREIHRKRADETTRRQLFGHC